MSPNNPLFRHSKAGRLSPQCLVPAALWKRHPSLRPCQSTHLFVMPREQSLKPATPPCPVWCGRCVRTCTAVQGVLKTGAVLEAPIENLPLGSKSVKARFILCKFVNICKEHHLRLKLETRDFLQD